MKCLVCRSSFFAQTHSSPAEDCDCGQNVTINTLRDYPEYDLDAAITAWRTKPVEDDDDGA